MGQGSVARIRRPEGNFTFFCNPLLLATPKFGLYPVRPHCRGLNCYATIPESFCCDPMEDLLDV